MRVIKPNKFTDAVLVSTNAVETVAVWNSGSTYAKGNLARRDNTHRIYENLIPGTSFSPPEVEQFAEVPSWLDVGPANRWAAFDNQINTTTVATTELTFTIAPGFCNSIAVFGIYDAYKARVTVKTSAGGSQVYDSGDMQLDATIITDWYEYFFELGIPKPDFVLTDLPPYFNAHITITLTGLPGAQVRCGVILAGNAYELGATQYGAKASIIDYSVKESDDFGETLFVKRPYSKRLEVEMELPNTRLNKIQYILAELRATPCAWLGVPCQGYDPLTVYGFYRDFSIVVDYHDRSRCSLEIEGLI